jgi:hypothetical protein
VACPGRVSAVARCRAVTCPCPDRAVATACRAPPSPVVTCRVVRCRRRDSTVCRVPRSPVVTCRVVPCRRRDSTVSQGPHSPVVPLRVVECLVLRSPVATCRVAVCRRLDSAGVVFRAEPCRVLPTPAAFPVPCRDPRRLTRCRARAGPAPARREAGCTAVPFVAGRCRAAPSRAAPHREGRCPVVLCRAGLRWVARCRAGPCLLPPGPSVVPVGRCPAVRKPRASCRLCR